jgi:3-hydroxyisobutyrate dehydrogenase-like beta-hydroxyacid dehydrogenase
MSRIAFLGTGLIGAGMIEAALRRGDEVVIWNRSHDKLAPLVEKGARAAADPASAVRDVERVHIALSDDAAVDAVLAAAAPGLASGTPVIDHSTTAPRGTAARAASCEARGVAFLHAPVFMGPQNAREATGLMLAAGPRARFDAVEPALAKMTSRVWWIGERPDVAAAYKLFGNAMILILTEGYADVLRIGASLGLAPDDAQALFAQFKPWGVVDHRGARMGRGDYAPSFAMTMARKDARLMLESAAPRDLVLLSAIAEHMDRLIAEGKGELDLGALGSDVVPPR